MTDASLVSFNNTPGVNPITQQGRIVLNGFKDGKELQARKAAASCDAALYPGPLDDQHYTMAKGEMAFYRTPVKNMIRHTQTADSTLHVFSAFNFAGRKGETREDFIESLQFAGWVQLWALQDSTNQNDDTALALVQGGLLTVPNTGPERIVKGSLIYWDLPDPSLKAIQANKNFSDRPSDKILAQTRPFRKDRHGATKKAVFRHLSTVLQLPGADTTAEALNRSRNSKLAGYAGTFYMGLRTAVLLGCIALAKAQDRPMSTQQQLEAAKTLDVVTSNDAFVQEQFKRFEQEFIEKLFGMAMSTKSGAPVAVAGAQSTLLFPLEKQGINESGDMAMLKMTIAQRQATAVEDILSGVAGMRDFVGRRVVARAQSTADPGKDMDIQIAPYSI